MTAPPGGPPRHLLVLATQCRSQYQLDGLGRAAAGLCHVLLDPAIGGCVPALPDGRALLAGRPGEEEIDHDTARLALGAAMDGAAEAGASLVLALLGHGFTPGDASRLFFMTADSTESRDSALNVQDLLAGAAERSGVEGVVALLDTCNAASGLLSLEDLVAGPRRGRGGLSVLTAAGAHQPAYDMRFSRELTRLLAVGLPGGSPELRAEQLAVSLRPRMPGQMPVPWGYGGSRPERLWVARNILHADSRGPSYTQGPAAGSSDVARGPVPHPPDRSYRGLRLKYLEWAGHAWSYIDLGGLGVDEGAADQQEAERLRRLDLGTMYVSLQADPRSLADRRRAELLRRLNEHEAEDSWGHTGRRDVRPSGVLPSAQADPQGSIALEEAFARHRTLVVLGPPGSGKSVLCQWLARTIADDSLDVLRRPREPAPAGRVRLPLRIRAADYARYYGPEFTRGEPPGSLAEFLAATADPALIERLAATRYVAQRMFERALAEGEAVLLIDGLDELVEHREDVLAVLTEAVRSHVAALPAAQVVITSRTAGYDEVYLPLDDAAHYLIRPMTGPQITVYCENFFGHLQQPQLASLMLRHLAVSDRAVQVLAATPILLTSMCMYMYAHGNLPGDQSQLYRELVLDTGYRWRAIADSTRGSALDGLLATPGEFLAVMAKIARRIHERHPDGRIGENDLREALEEALFGLGRLTGERRTREALSLVDLIRGKVGILAEDSPGRFGFIHQTFREYLVGHDLLDAAMAGPGTPAAGDAGTDEPPAAVAVRLAGRVRENERLADHRWRVPILLAIEACTPQVRGAVIGQAAAGDAWELEEWADLLLPTDQEGSVAAREAGELRALLILLARFWTVTPAEAETVEEYDHRLALLRGRVGAERFDEVALSLMEEDDALVGPLSALYGRRQWLTRKVLAVLARVGHADSGEWGWPVQRALRRASAGTPERQVLIRGQFETPGDEDDSEEAAFARRLAELGPVPWQRQRLRVAEETVQEVPAGLLPVRDLLTARPDRFGLCLADDAVARVLCVLFGGLDHHDTVHWSAEYDDFAQMLSLPNRLRESAIERRAAELVPRFGTIDVVYNIAVLLDTVGTKVTTRGKPRAAIEARWLSRGCDPGLTSAVRGWALATPGEAGALRRILENAAGSAARTVPEPEPGFAPAPAPASEPGFAPAPLLASAFASASVPVSASVRASVPASASAVPAGAGPVAAGRAEAELGLLVLDGRPMTDGPDSLRAVEAAIEATADAFLREVRHLVEAVWADEVPENERPALHRYLLHVAFLAAGRPVDLGAAPGFGPGSHPVRMADGLARRALGGAWFENDVTDLDGLEGDRLPAVLGWFSTLPYVQVRRDANLLEQSGPPAPWLTPEVEPDRELGVPVETLHSLLGWFHRTSPWVGGLVVEGLVTASRQPRRGYDEEPGSLQERCRALLLDASAQPEEDLLDLLADPVHSLPATDVCARALLLIALAGRLPLWQRPRRHLAALALLAGARDADRLAEALYRCRGHLSDEPEVRAAFARLTAGLDSPVLRADAAGDLVGCAEALAARLADTDLGQPARVVLLTVPRLLAEGERLRSRAARYPDAHRPVLPGRPDGRPVGLRALNGTINDWSLPLDRQLLDQLPAFVSTTEGEAALAYQLSLATAVTADVVPELARLAGLPSAAGQRWASTARDLLALHAALPEDGPPDLPALAGLVLRADAGVGARARLELLGPYVYGRRPTRHHLLSQRGVDAWWRLGRAAATADLMHRGLLLSALYQWDVDDADAVAESLRRAAADEDGWDVWAQLAAPGTIWRDGPQQVLAEWLDSGQSVAPGALRAVVETTSCQITAASGIGVTDELIAAVARACVRGRFTGLLLPDLPAGQYSFGVAWTVAAVCHAALAGAAPGQDDLVQVARGLLRDAAVPLCAADGGPDRNALAQYSDLVWHLTYARAEQAAQWIPAELDAARAIPLLWSWLRTMAAECRLGDAAPLDDSVSTALLHLLVVLGDRDPTAFQLHLSPEEAQPVLSVAAVNKCDEGRESALRLMSRLRYVHLDPPGGGPGLIEVLEFSMRGTARVCEAAFHFVEHVQRIQGGSLVGALLDRLDSSGNELVAQGLIGLAAACYRSPGCSAAESLRIRRTLRALGGTPRRLVQTAGSGSTEDDRIMLALGPDRRTAFRRLVRTSGAADDLGRYLDFGETAPPGP